MTSVLVDRVTLLDSRAAKGRGAGLVAFLCATICWSLMIPFVFLDLGLVEPELSNGLILIALGFLLNGVLAFGVVKLIGGKVVKADNISADISARGIFIADLVGLEAAAIRKVRVRRYKGGCMDVVVHDNKGRRVEIVPSVSLVDQDAWWDEYCRACERMREWLRPLK